MKRNFALLLFAACSRASSPTPAVLPSQSPAPHEGTVDVSAKKAAVAEVYFDQTVNDKHRWLEDHSAAMVSNWLQAQNAEARRQLALAPATPAIKDRLESLLSQRDVIEGGWLSSVAGQVLYLRRRNSEGSASLYVRTKGEERLLFRASEDGSSVIDHLSLSPDGRFVAFGVASGGSEDNTLHIVEVATGRELPERIAHLTYPLMSWLTTEASNGPSAFYYSRFPHFAEGTSPPIKDEMGRMRVGENSRGLRDPQ